MDNPSAFPGISGSSGNGESTPIYGPDGALTWQNHNQGMTLRDYIAAKAMAAVLCGLITRGQGPINAEEQNALAMRCYEQADCMLATRTQVTPKP